MGPPPYPYPSPLQVLGLERYVSSVSRAALGQPEVSDRLGFDVSAHPDARSKVAVDMLARLSADTQAFAAPDASDKVPRRPPQPRPERDGRRDMTGTALFLLASASGLAFSRRRPFGIRTALHLERTSTPRHA